MQDVNTSFVSPVGYAHGKAHAEGSGNRDQGGKDVIATREEGDVDRGATSEIVTSAGSAPVASISGIAKLPPELIAYLLNHIPPADLQRTALALHTVFPDLRLAEHFLWRHVVVRRSGQLMPLWRAGKARRSGSGSGSGVRTFTMESWTGDADILNNGLRCLPDIDHLVLNMGTNFAPEHLQDMFDEPRRSLKRLELRFRPYVAQASYYQFLKGSYFDSAIETLTKTWPESPAFTRLSIVQDIPPRGTAPATAVHSVVPSTVASPTVSKLPSAATSIAPSAVQSTAPSALPSAVHSAVASIVNSPSLAATTSASIATTMADLALESSSDTESSGYSTPPTSQSDSSVEPKGYTGHGPFPYLAEKLGWARPTSFAQPIVFFDIKCIARFGASPVARHLTHIRLRVPSRDVATVLTSPMRLFPSLRYLDISTTNVRMDTTLSALLRNYHRLEHLVMDRVNLFGFQARDKGMDMCRELGGMVLSAGLARGKERERLIAAWDVAERTQIAIAAAPRTAPANGAAQAASNGGPVPGGETEAIIARARRGHRSANQATFSLRDRSRLRSTSTSAAPSLPPNITLPPTDRLYLVLPPLPSLKTLCIGGEAHHVPPHKVRDWTNEFHSGWREGLGKVMGWAGHVGERYERAKKKADEWIVQEIRSGGSSAKASTAGGNSKGKGRALPKVSMIKPPTDVRLFRFPLAGEEPDHAFDEADPTSGLVEIHPAGREYLDAYKGAIADAEMYANDHSYTPPCVLCMVPDCEGPVRRGDEGLKVDGRGGMDGVHASGCGHEVGRRIWGWEGM